ncbi:hypothetical protein RFH39_08535 [Acinetobacter baumannii]|uniref:hypothetical protein n=1 Tax=Acinetobacter baumannii TaxID=470 RepID=UPI00280F1211|nr:hypothetical protein [Acinetobacter baumannii]MDQ8918309.1 hypothetical protein [Acinetobacter baumannii]MDQ8949263.1 hypothetical protein [Acinetobacter baumannii]MDQ8963431.1 hypothetical protein [Acinetobacter baumannii]MDQ8967118.1 hypothetical protein [Acinetobacter baumannii]MDQ8981124.1 hypothetical protein [Acinetobacter baumannii]
MRDYGKVSPHFWTGITGKKLRQTPEGLIVAMYLMTSPHANMLGLYYMPLLYIAHETGLGFEGASKGLQSACEAGFCSYDEATETVWVHEMARFQVAESLKPADNRCKNVQKEYDSLPSSPYLSSFFDKYAQAFCMTQKRGENAKINTPFKAPSNPLRSQEQEQEQEQDNTHTPPAAENFSAAEESWKPNRELLLNVLRTSQVGAQAEQVLEMPNYEFHLGNFNAHWENKIDLTENQRIRKFATWLIQEFAKPTRPKKQNSSVKTAPARDVNSAWGSAKQYAPATDDIDVGEML